MKDFAIKHKVTGLFFGGFDAANEILWVSADQAKRMTKDEANLQASLFRCFDKHVQRTPATIK